MTGRSLVFVAVVVATAAAAPGANSDAPHSVREVDLALAGSAD